MLPKGRVLFCSHVQLQPYGVGLFTSPILRTLHRGAYRHAGGDRDDRTMRGLAAEHGAAARLFLAATLCATSVGITARVLKDLGKLQTSEAKIILGAAVVDDVLGLIILAVVVGIVATGQIHVLEIGRISLLACLYLGAVLLVGDRFIRWVLPLVTALDRHHCKLLFPLALAFVMAWLATRQQRMVFSSHSWCSSQLPLKRRPSP